MFVHYTSNINVLSKILSSGLFINQCKRNLMHLFTDNTEVLIREPQHFGMTCVRDEDKVGSKKHCDKFGYFGIALTKEWVSKNEFLPVHYIDSKNCNYLRETYQLAIAEWSELKATSNDGFFREALFNKHMAKSVGAFLLSDWLSEYEYLEPKAHEYQKEWRHVQSLPLYNSRDFTELIEAIQKPSWSRLLRCVKLTLDDIEYFVTSNEHASELSTWLDINKINKEIIIKKYIKEPDWITSGLSRIYNTWRN